MHSVAHFLWASNGFFCFLLVRILYVSLFGFVVFRKVSKVVSYAVLQLLKLASLLFCKALTADKMP